MYMSPAVHMVSRYIHNVLEMYDSGSESSVSESAGKTLNNTADMQLFVKA